MAERPGWARDFNRPTGTETRRMRGDRHPCERSWHHDPKTGWPRRPRIAAWTGPPRDEVHRARRKDLQRPVPAARREAHGIVLRPPPRARWLRGLHGWGVAEGRRQEGLVRHPHRGCRDGRHGQCGAGRVAPAPAAIGELREAVAPLTALPYSVLVRSSPLSAGQKTVRQEISARSPSEFPLFTLSCPALPLPAAALG